MLTEIFGPYWGLPVAGIVFGILAYGVAWHSSRRFDRKYGPKA